MIALAKAGFISLLCALGICVSAAPAEAGLPATTADPKGTPRLSTRQKLTGFEVMATSDAQFHLLNDRSLIFNSGEALVEARRTGVIVTPMCVTFVKKGSVIFLRARTGYERVMDFWDESSKSVVVVFRGCAAPLMPGVEALLTDHKPFYREIHQSDKISRRLVRRYFVGDGLYMTTGEFFLPHALAHSGLISSSLAGDRILTHKVLKAASILAAIGKRTPFVAGLPLEEDRFEPGDPLSAHEDLLPPIESPHAPAKAMP